MSFRYPLIIPQDKFWLKRAIDGKLSGFIPLRMKACRVGRTNRVPTIVRWSFVAFAFTIPLEYRLFNLMKLSGFLLFLSYCFYYNPLSHKRSFARPPKAMWWFLGYVAIYMINGLFIYEEFLSQFHTHLLTLLQLVLFFWVASDILQEEKVAKDVLLSYSIASTILALAIIFGLTASSQTRFGADGQVTVWAGDPNSIAIPLTLASVTLIGLLMNSTFRQNTSKILVIVMTMLLLQAIVNTGSRSGMGSVVIGCLVYLLPSRQSRGSRYVKSRALGVILAILSVIAVVYMTGSSSTALSRWQAVYEGDVNTRDEITRTAIDMLIEQPLFGWQPVAVDLELGARVRSPSGVRGTHNLFLHLLLQVGMVGTIPFLVGLWLCGWAAWKARTGNFGLLPLALLLTMLAANMTHTFMAVKELWLILALAFATASTAAKGQEKRPLRF
jgi:O-antigen ligase